MMLSWPSAVGVTLVLLYKGAWTAKCLSWLYTTTLRTISYVTCTVFWKCRLWCRFADGSELGVVGYGTTGMAQDRLCNLWYDDCSRWPFIASLTCRKPGLQTRQHME
ncbi:hypothetical protein BKA83DRAFT_4194148, partial [Pisolithus microcarpus]